ncbi:allophanate hydrolase [Clostridium sp.]|uniref:allophanate hydrolase n=1 Tax=Clostridium sp. TaxID=1506 RepID=UPI00359F92C1
MKNEDIPIILSIKWLREKYIKKELTPEKVIYEIINRAKEDSNMNIWITPPSVEIIKPYLDKLAGTDVFSLPLWGIPFAIKDNIDLQGVKTTAACNQYAYIPEKSAVVVERLIAAGAIPLGKTNLDQFATGLVGTRSPYGETHNSLKEELISGGSSSGSAVAVARGQAAFSLGTDTAGSGRVPAALNNLVGYKPPLGAWSTKGVVPACVSLDCVTVFAHSLGDIREVDAVVRGYCDVDPWSKDIKLPIAKLPKKICLPKEMPYFYGPYAEGYKKAWSTTIEKLKELNIPIEYIDYGLFSEAAAILYDGPWVAERWADLGDFVKANKGAVFPVTEQILCSGSDKKYTAASVFNALHKLQDFKLKAIKILKNKVLVMPTCGGTWTRAEVRENPISTNSDMGLYTNHCNLLDLCAVAVPEGEVTEKVPFGITLFSLAEQECFICGAAELFTDNSERTDMGIKSLKDTTLVAVCGLHMRGYPLEKQMLESGARFISEAVTAPKYSLVKLPTTPAKLGLIKMERGGAAINLEIWEMPMSVFGTFTASIPAPLGIGKVELQNGLEIPGFICESYAANYSEDITLCESWRNS